MSFAPKLLSAAVLMALAGTAAAAVKADNPAVGRALGLIQTHGAAARASADDRFVASDLIVDANGTEHVRFDRSYKGLPVIGGDLVIHSRAGQFGSASLTQSSPLALSTRANINANDAAVTAGASFGSRFEGSPKSSLVVYARGQGAAKLAWQVELSNADADMTYIVDAKNGRMLESWSNLETAAATGTGKTIYSGNVSLNTNSTSTGFEMRDMAHGGSYTFDCNGCSTNSPAKAGTPFTDADNVWGSNTTSDRASAGADAHFGVSKTWEFYASLGRNGIDGTGKQSFNRVHVGRNYVNAFWSDGCFCMSYGDGDGVTYAPLVDLDVAGHEMSHGVTATTSKLVYSGESGGLNEANSDIMGTMVEFFANNALDTPDYLIGEEIYISNAGNTKALRWMFNPIKDGLSPNCYVSNIGSKNVHYSSGVANHFFYLLAEGSGAKSFSGVDHTSPTCNGVAQAGIGRDAATRIWFRGMTVYMTSSTNYAGARVATLKAAADLYGGVGSPTWNAVAAAWSAVSVN
jgi:Zn-dependent metalloprotease